METTLLFCILSPANLSTMHSILKYLPGFFLLFAFTSCQKDEDPNLSPVADFGTEDAIDRIVLINQSSDPDGDALRSEWKISTGQAVITESGGQVFIRLSQKGDEEKITVTLTVTDGRESHSVSKEIVLPAWNWSREHGFGKKITEEKSLDRNYDWYIDQGNTGPYSSMNCGPACVTMAIRWADPEFSGTVQDARNHYLPVYSSGLPVPQMVDYLSLHGLSGEGLNFNIETLLRHLRKGQIAIVSLDMYYIRKAENPQESLDCFYTTSHSDWFHYILIKGFKIIDDTVVLLEVYDPYSLGLKYEKSGDFLGIDRLYRVSDFTQGQMLPGMLLVTARQSSVH